MPNRTLKFYSEPQVKPAALNRTYFVHSYSEPAGQHMPGGAIQTLQFSRGTLRIDEMPITQPQFGPRTVSWKQQTADSFTAGQLSFSLDTLECRGTIALGANAQSAKLINVIATAVPSSTYVTQISKQRYPAGTDAAGIAAGEWSKGLPLQLSFSYGAGAAMPALSVSSNGQDITASTTVKLIPGDKEDLLEVTFQLDPDNYPADASLYLSGSLRLSLSENSFSGTLSSISQDRKAKGVYLWKGSANEAVALRVPQPKQMTAVKLVQSSTLNVGELFSLLPDEDVSQMANALLVENTKWAMGQDPAKKAWVTDFFAQQPPVLAAERTDLIKQHLDWYQNQFSVAYLTQGFNSMTGPGAPSVKLDVQQQAKLDNYLRNGLAASDAYNVQSTGIYGQAHVLAKPALRAYINDPSTNWAQAFYDAINTDAEWRNVINLVYTSHDVSMMNRYATLLHTLEPAGTLAKQYTNKALTTILLHASLQTVITDEDAAMAWMPLALKAFVDQHGAPNPAMKSFAAAGSSDEQQIADSINDAILQFGSYTELARWIVKCFIIAKGVTVATQVQGAVSAFTAQFPKLSTLAKAFLWLAWVGALFNVAQAFRGWTNLSGTEKTNAIAQCAQTVGIGADLVLDFYRTNKLLDLQGELYKAVTNEPLAKECERLLNAGDEEGFEAALNKMAEAQAADQTAVYKLQAQWEKNFSIASKAISAVFIVVQLAMGVLSSLDLAEDIKQGKPITKEAFDGMLAVASFASAVCLAVDVAVSSAVFALAGAVFAIIGVIASIVLMFLPQPTPESPVDTFMKNDGKKFVDSLPESTTQQPATLVGAAA